MTAETCCAEEKRINYQNQGSEGLSKKRLGKINKEGCLQINCNAIILWSHKPSFILWPSWFFCYSTLQMNLLNLLYVCGFPFF